MTTTVQKKKKKKKTNKTREARIEDEVLVACPHCFETQLLVVDPATEGTMVQDCDVCCRPWEVHVARDPDGALLVTIDPA